MEKRDLKTKQWRQLEKVLQRAFKSSRFYKEKFTKAGFTSASDIKTWKDFRKLPFTTRQELGRDQAKNSPLGTNLTRPLSEYTQVMITSGTTGEPLLLPVTSEDFNRAVEVEKLTFKVRGISKRDTFSIIGGGQYSSIYLTLFQQQGGRYCSILYVGSIRVLHQLEKFCVTVLETSPSVIIRLTKVAEEEKIDLKKLSIRMILTFGEQGGNTPEFRSLVKEKWGVESFDLIGSLENGTFTSVCRKALKHHFLEGYSKYWIFEVIDPQTKKASKKGELVITNLWKLDFPFLRYRTGDIVELEEGKCTCGRSTPRFKNGIIGRADRRVNIRGVLLYPEQIERVIKKYTYFGHYEAWLTKEDGIEVLEVYFEPTAGSTWQSQKRLTQHLQQIILAPVHAYPLPAGILSSYYGWKREWFFDMRDGKMPRFLRRKITSGFYKATLRLKGLNTQSFIKYFVR